MGFVNTDVAADLIVNKLNRFTYDKLGQYSQLDENQLYLVDDTLMDAYGKRIANVAYPRLSSDAATKGYVDDNLSAASIIHSVAELSSMSYSDLNDDVKSKIGVATGFRYKLINGIVNYGQIEVPNDLGELQTENHYYVDIEDFAVTTVTLSTEYADGVYIRFPAALDDRVRDFILKIKVLTETTPTVTFISKSGESIDFESDDDSWAAIEPGANFMLFTETERK